jgi:hypothetical protein
LCSNPFIMEEQNNEKGQVWASLKEEFLKKKVADIGVFTVKKNDFWLVKGFKYAVNYTMFGFVMFMTGIVLFITVLVA